jgi:hypothetical protein
MPRPSAAAFARRLLANGPCRLLGGTITRCKGTNNATSVVRRRGHRDETSSRCHLGNRQQGPERVCSNSWCAQAGLLAAAVSQIAPPGLIDQLFAPPCGTSTVTARQDGFAARPKQASSRDWSESTVVVAGPGAKKAIGMKQRLRLTGASRGKVNSTCILQCRRSHSHSKSIPNSGRLSATHHRRVSSGVGARHWVVPRLLTRSSASSDNDLLISDAFGLPPAQSGSSRVFSLI